MTKYAIRYGDASTAWRLDRGCQCDAPHVARVVGSVVQPIVLRASSSTRGRGRAPRGAPAQRAKRRASRDTREGGGAPPGRLVPRVVGSYALREVEKFYRARATPTVHRPSRATPATAHWQCQWLWQLRAAKVAQPPGSGWPTTGRTAKVGGRRDHRVGIRGYTSPGSRSMARLRPGVRRPVERFMGSQDMAHGGP